MGIQNYDSRMALVLAWRDFCDGLKALGEEVLSEEGAATGVDHVSGLRRVAMMLSSSLAWYLDCADPAFPRLGQIKDTPEIADYWYAPISGGSEYYLTGNISTVFDVNISIQPGRPWARWTRRGGIDAHSAKLAPIGDIGRGDLALGPDGSFKLYLGPHPEKHDNALKVPDEGGLLMIREYMYDWTRDRPGTYELARVGSEFEAPSRQTVEGFGSMLNSIYEFVGTYQRNAHPWITNTEPNQMLPPMKVAAGNSNISYTYGRFKLTPYEAMILEFPTPDARAWCVQWLIPDPWYSNPDILNRSTSLMGSDAYVDEDARVRVVVSQTDTGAPNWLDISGFESGTLLARWLWCEDAPDVQSHIVDVHDVRAHLPQSSPHVDRKERGAAIRRRRSHFAYRGR
jgi:hypothetical protein